MANTILVDTIIDRFLSPSFPEQTGKPYYKSIQETHRILTKNMASTNSTHGWGQKGHLGLILTATQYALTRTVPFIHQINTG